MTGLSLTKFREEMEMRHNKWMMASLLGGALLLTVGCARETWTEMGGEPGSPIIFSALSSYENNDATRTEYSGEVVEGVANKVERIDWVKDVDQFTVNYASSSQNSTGTYVVKSVEAENYNSKAGVEPSAASAMLAWAGDSDHKFYAMYPSSVQNSAASLTSVNHFQGTLNPTQDPRKKNGSFEMQEVTDYGITWNRYMPDMKYAYMVAYADTQNGMISGNSVTLPFRPAVTTFEFRLRKMAGQAVANVKKFELVADNDQALTGTFSFDITGGDDRGASWGQVTVPEQTSANKVITVNFGDEGVALPDASENNYLDFTIFALPVDLEALSIRITDKDNKVRTLPLKDKGKDPVVYHTFTGAKKWVITNSDIPGEWVYVLEEIPDIVTYGHTDVTGLGFNVKSYKYRKTVSGVPPAAVQAVAWKTQYTLDDGNTWADLDQDDGKYIAGPENKWNATFKTSQVSGIGITSTSDAEARTASILGVAQGDMKGDEVAAAQRAKLVTHAPRGTSKNDAFDLSTHPVYGNIDTAVPQTTANSYVISAPGYYMFPCVYGNGITNGSTNKSAFWPGAASDASVTGDSGAGNLQAVNTNYNTDDAYWRAYTPRFYNALNTEINSEYIVTDLNANSLEAIVVWQDTEADGVGTINQIIPMSGEDYMGVKKVGSVDYIWFRMDPDRIKPGNFVIALRGKAGSLTRAEILWSWHIWVTPENLDPTDVVGGYQLMPKNLGWFDTDKGSTVQWPVRQIQYRIVQTEPATDVDQNKQEPFQVKQIGEAKTTEPSVGGNVFYQWGRKDPFLPSTPSGGNHVVVYNADYQSRITQTANGIEALPIENDNLDYGASIRQPYSPFYNGTAISYLGGPVYPYAERIEGGTEVSTWTFKTELARRKFFTSAQAAAIAQNTSFCDQTDWRQFEVGYLYHNNAHFYPGPYTNEEAEILLTGMGPGVDTGFTSDDFTGSSDNWYLKSWKLGPFTLDQANNTTRTRYNKEGTPYWFIPTATNGLTNYCYLREEVPFNLGPYNQAEATILMQNGYDPTGSDFTVSTTTVGGGGVPYPASDRAKAANVTNLWNAYLYDEDTAGSSYDNKYKTIYDPCPPGFTVPVRQVFIGNRKLTDADRETSYVNNMHMKVVPGSEVLVGQSPTLYNTGYGDNPEMKGMRLSNGVFFPYTGARVYRNEGGYNVLHAEGVGTAGYYWTDAPFRMDWRWIESDPIFHDANHPLGVRPWNESLYQNPTLVSQLWFFHDAFGFIFGTDFRGDQYVTDSWRVQSYTRATAFSVRPMKDPKVSY